MLNNQSQKHVWRPELYITYYVMTRCLIFNLNVSFIYFSYNSFEKIRPNSSRLVILLGRVICLALMVLVKSIFTWSCREHSIEISSSFTTAQGSSRNMSFESRVREFWKKAVSKLGFLIGRIWNLTVKYKDWRILVLGYVLNIFTAIF